MLLNTLFLLIASISFLFIFWKKLKDDYVQNQIFSSGFYSLIGITVGALLSFYFFQQWWFWLGFAGLMLGMCIGVIRYSLRFFELLEAVVAGGIIVFFELLLFRLLLNPGLVLGFAVITVFLIYILYLLLNRHYKKFTWYASGRVGFSGLVSLGIFFLIRSLVAVYLPDMLSFVGNYESILSGVSAFISFLLLFNLSRN